MRDGHQGRFVVQLAEGALNCIDPDLNVQTGVRGAGKVAVTPRCGSGVWGA